MKTHLGIVLCLGMASPSMAADIRGKSVIADFKVSFGQFGSEEKDTIYVGVNNGVYWFNSSRGGTKSMLNRWSHVEHATQRVSYSGANLITEVKIPADPKIGTNASADRLIFHIAGDTCTVSYELNREPATIEMRSCRVVAGNPQQ